MADDYTPSEPTVRHSYVVIEARSDRFEARAEFARFIEGIKRDAARETLDGLAENYEHDAFIRIYRDTHYPEEAR